MKSLSCLAAVLMISGCASLGGPSDRLRSDGIARIGETTRSGPLLLTPEKLVEDSRCPADVQCVWAGRLVVLTRIDGPGWRLTIPLALGEDQPAGGYIVRLIRAEPQARAGEKPAPADYSFTYQAH